MENEWWNIVLYSCEAFDGDLQGLSSSGISAGEKKAVKAMRRKLKDFECYAKTVVEMSKAVKAMRRKLKDFECYAKTVVEMSKEQ